MEKKNAIVLYSVIIIVVVGVVIAGAVYYKDTLSDLFGLAIVSYGPEGTSVSGTMPLTITFGAGENTATFFYDGKEYTLVLGKDAAGKDVVQISLVGVECVDDSTCPTGTRCLNNVCVESLPSGTGTSGTTCSENRDCNEGLECIKGTCQVSSEPLVVVAQRICRTDADCTPDLCVGGYCMASGETAK